MKYLVSLRHNLKAIQNSVHSYCLVQYIQLDYWCKRDQWGKVARIPELVMNFLRMSRYSTAWPHSISSELDPVWIFPWSIRNHCQKHCNLYIFKGCHLCTSSDGKLGLKVHWRIYQTHYISNVSFQMDHKVCIQTKYSETLTTFVMFHSSMNYLIVRLPHTKVLPLMTFV